MRLPIEIKSINHYLYFKRLPFGPLNDVSPIVAPHIHGDSTLQHVALTGISDGVQDLPERHLYQQQYQHHSNNAKRSMPTMPSTR